MIFNQKDDSGPYSRFDFLILPARSTGRGRRSSANNGHGSPGRRKIPVRAWPGTRMISVLVGYVEELRNRIPGRLAAVCTTFRSGSTTRFHCDEQGPLIHQSR